MRSHGNEVTTVSVRTPDTDTQELIPQRGGEKAQSTGVRAQARAALWGAPLWS